MTNINRSVYLQPPTKNSDSPSNGGFTKSIEITSPSTLFNTTLSDVITTVISFIDDETTTYLPNTTTAQPDIPPDHFCKVILYKEIGSSRFRIWDLLLFIPAIAFLIGLLIKLNNARLKLRAVHSPIYATFYALTWMNAIIALVRCIVSMTVNAKTPSGDEANKILFVIVRFFLLATEMSVVTFGIFFGHLDNKTSIRRVLLLTSMIALPYSIVQGALELLSPDEDFYVPSKEYNLYGHGGTVFFLVSSIIFTMVYALILLLRMNCLRKRFLFLMWMPVKTAFYVYLSFLCILNFFQSIGAALYHNHVDTGLCIINLTTWTYFSLLTPLIYFTFIYQVFGKKNNEHIENIVFSYKSDDDDDTSSLPLPNADFTTNQNIYQGAGLPYSTLTEEVNGSQIPVNPLYTASLQSPDSITGYSINSVDSITITAYDKSQTQ